MDAYGTGVNAAAVHRALGKEKRRPMQVILLALTSFPDRSAQFQYEFCLGYMDMLTGNRSTIVQLGLL